MIGKQKAEGRRQKCVPVTGTFVVCFLLSAFVLSVRAENGAFKSTSHGDAKNGPQRKPEAQRGSCVQCHDGHASHDNRLGGAGDGKAPLGLFAANDNNLCFTCHVNDSRSHIFPGSGEWLQSSHGRSTQLVWPGPSPKARPFSDSGKCLNCHTPHGTRDETGVVPGLLILREEKLCYGCHDGSHARTDLAREFRKQFHHPVELIGRHAADETDHSDRFAASPKDNRHSECSDCHNAHAAATDRVPPSAPDASEALAGVSRVQVTNGPAGTLPVYSWRGPEQRGRVREFEICFKCHSSWTKLPPGKPDLALLTSPSNPSYHAIQAAGKDRRIDSASFVNGWSSSRLMYCGDCHGSDDVDARGPHGSAYKYILKKPASTTTQRQAMPEDDLCFSCHAYGVYGDASSPEPLQRASRFNLPSASGHAFHVGLQNVTCYSCHETHGSTTLPSLIATRRLPGIISYLQSESGGTCVSSCHEVRQYTTNYPR